MADRLEWAARARLALGRDRLVRIRPGARELGPGGRRALNTSSLRAAAVTCRAPVCRGSRQRLVGRPSRDMDTDRLAVPNGTGFDP